MTRGLVRDNPKLPPNGWHGTTEGGVKKSEVHLFIISRIEDEGIGENQSLIEKSTVPPCCFLRYVIV